MAKLARLVDNGATVFYAVIMSLWGKLVKMGIWFEQVMHHVGWECALTDLDTYVV